MRTLMLTIVCLFFLLACKSREREKQLEAKEMELNTKEQQLILKEKTLQFREQELNERLRVADSIRSTDSLVAVTDSIAGRDTAAVNNALVGDWKVKMTCIETTCPGSAVGDTRVEQWNLSYAGNHLVAKATDHGNLIRTYSGIFNPNTIELIEHRDSALVYDTRMVVRLRPVDDQNIKGQREIIRENDCRIVYSVTMDKI